MGCGSSQPSVPANGVPVHDASAQPKSSAMSPGKTSGSPVKKVAFSGAKPGKGSAGKEKVALVGSGNWGSAIATKIGRNVLSNTMFDKEVMMWVFEEYVKEEDGKWVRPARGAQPPEGKTWVDEGYEPLTEVINRLNENVIYLPGIKLPKSIVATPDIKKCVTGATMMVFVIPHNFLAPIVPKMEGAFRKGACGISLIKGIEFKDSKPILISDLLAAEMKKARPLPPHTPCLHTPCLHTPSALHP